MEQGKTIKNILYNYYAISRIELEKLEDKSSIQYLINYYAENVIKSLLNNSFCQALYSDALNLLIYLDKENNSVIDNNKHLYDVLKDSLGLYDSKLLKKDDPIDSVMQVVLIYLNKHKDYERIDDQVLMKHRYDVIFDNMKNNESFGSLLIKMNINLFNQLVKLSLSLRKEHKDNILSDSLDNIRSLYYSLYVSLLFKDHKALSLRRKYLEEYFITLLALFDIEADNEKMIRKLNLYSDYYYSYNHNIKLPSQDEVFKNKYGFLSINGIIPKMEDLKNLYFKEDDKTDMFKSVKSINLLFMKFNDKLLNRYPNKELEEINLNIKQTLNDINLLLLEIR